jgi:hypothetical protein
MIRRSHLDQIVLDVEFVLLAVVQGVALTALGVEAVPVLRHPNAIAWVLLTCGFLFVLVFWAGALIHALSIVRWPMDLPHYFFYFAVGLLEMITFAQMQHPQAWFGWSAVFFVVGDALYAYDFLLIRLRRGEFMGRGEPERRLYDHIVRRQVFEMVMVMPAGFTFCLIAWWALGAHPGWALSLAVMQLVFTLGFLLTVTRSFAARVRLISECIDPVDPGPSPS